KLFADAIAFNQKYEAGYTSLIESLRKNGGKSAALDIATQGLRHIPTSNRLQKTYLELGGKTPFPEPFEAAPPVSAPAQTDSTVEATTSESSETGPEVAPSTGC